VRCRVMVRLYKSDVPKFPLLNGYSFNNFGNPSTKTNLLILFVMNFCVAVLGAQMLTHIALVRFSRIRTYEDSG